MINSELPISPSLKMTSSGDSFFSVQNERSTAASSGVNWLNDGCWTIKLVSAPDAETEGLPPCQNSCRLLRKPSKQGTMMKDLNGSIRTRIQRQGGSEVVAT